MLSVCGKVGAVTLTADDVGALELDDIVNVLTSDLTTKALSAAQGKVLKDLIGVWTNLDAYFTGASVVESLNQLITTIGTSSLDSDFGAITDVIGALNYLVDNKVTSSTVKAVRYDAGSFSTTTDGTTWYTLTGAQGLQGKGYNPRGAWVSGRYLCKRCRHYRHRLLP